MALKDTLLPEFDHEMAVTRRLLERVPFADAGWKPHPKSMSLGELASHLADIPGWTSVLLRSSGFDMDGAGGGGPKQQPTHEALLAAFDANVRSARDLIADTSDAQFMEPWTLRGGGQEIFTQPKVGVLRGWLFSHSIHHRGQLSVYLRLRDVPVPAIYGPSADER
jgi:uncharacterized damage-inducible protein DinB